MSSTGGRHEWTSWYELGLIEESELGGGKARQSKLEVISGSHAQGEKPRDAKREGRQGLVVPSHPSLLQ